MKVDCAVIGGGIVGLSVAMYLLRKQPGLKLVVLEKESELSFHQSGRNSGVIHFGIYYRPGSLKARFAEAVNRSISHFCEGHRIPHEKCGTLIVANDETQLRELDSLRHRGAEDGLKFISLARDEVRELEPHVECVRALRVPSTAIVSYRKVCATYAEILRREGGVIQTGAEVMGIRHLGGGHVLETPAGEVESRFLINCGGLQSDRIARRTGLDPEARIIPIRGEYYDLVPERRHLVNGLIYPVPDPAFPFLGVHFTRMIDGSVHAGPNAVLALRREGYKKMDIGMGALVETLSHRGFWRMARRHYKKGFEEIRRSFSEKLFVRSLQRLVPEVTEQDLTPATAGVRAQALRSDGQLVDDFLIVHGPSSIHVCNAPSPAATASLEIGKAIAQQVSKLRTAMTC